MVHGVSPLLIETLSGINQQDTTLPLSLHTPEMTITRFILTTIKAANLLVADLNVTFLNLLI